MAKQHGSALDTRYTPTRVRFNGGANLQIKPEFESEWQNFVVKGINLNMTPPGFNPGTVNPTAPIGTGRIWPQLGNMAQVQWFAEQFSAIGGNAVRVYFDAAGQVPDNDGNQGIGGKTDYEDLMQALDIFHAHGIKVMLNVFVRFFSAFHPSQTGSNFQINWYKERKIDEFIKCVQRTKSHPAIYAYLFGNETNITNGGDTSPNSSNLQGLAPSTFPANTNPLHASNVAATQDWFQMVNRAVRDAKAIDPNHIFGICSGLGNPDLITVHLNNMNLLPDLDFVGANIYRGPNFREWMSGDAPSAANSGPTFWSQWTSSVPLIITETGNDSYNNLTSSQDEATQASVMTQMWNNYISDGTAKCAGIHYFSSNDEYWKSGTTGTNANGLTYTNSGYPGNDKGFKILPDGFGNEQHFGWWKVMPTTPYSNPPAAKAVVAAMDAIW